jgi:hypothetical protein
VTVDLDKVRDAEVAFGLGASDGHEVLMLIGPMANEIRELRTALARHQAAIQAVRDVCDKADVENISITHSGARWPTTVHANRIRVAIAAELEKP